MPRRRPNKFIYNGNLVMRGRHLQKFGMILGNFHKCKSVNSCQVPDEYPNPQVTCIKESGQNINEHLHYILGKAC